MIKIKQQTVESDDICEKVLTDIFGNGHTFSFDEYDTLCTIIEQTLVCVSEKPKDLGYFVKGKSKC